MDLIACYGENEDGDDENIESCTDGGAGVALDLQSPVVRERTSLPVHVYIEVAASLAEGAALAAAASAYTAWFARALVPVAPALAARARWCALPDSGTYVRTPLHCSLSRYCEVSEAAAPAFIAALRAALGSNADSAVGAFSFSLEGCVALPASREARSAGGSGAALFLAALVGAGRPRVLALLARVNAVMRAHGLPVYYEPAEPHVSLVVLRVSPGAAATDDADVTDAAAALAAAGADAASAADVSLESAPPLAFTVGEVACKVGKRVFRIGLDGGERR